MIIHTSFSVAIDNQTLIFIGCPKQSSPKSFTPQGQALELVRHSDSQTGELI